MEKLDFKEKPAPTFGENGTAVGRAQNGATRRDHWNQAIVAFQTTGVDTQTRNAKKSLAVLKSIFDGKALNGGKERDLTLPTGFL